VSWIRTTLLTLAAAAIALAAQRLGDYPGEAAASLEAIARGDLGGFASAATPYAGSLTLRAPFVAVAGALGGDRLDLYRAGVFACLLAAVALAVVLDRASASRPPAARVATAALILGLPVGLDALNLGHPEEVLTASLAILAVWAAPKRPVLAGALLGVAVACKPWALVALGPVLLCASGGRVRLLAAAAAGGLAALAPFLADLGHSSQIAAATGRTGTLWVPYQLWWPLGTAHHHAVPDGVGGVLDVITWTAPGWIGTASRGLIVALGAPLAALAFARGRRGRADALLLLALLLHLRCGLDPWNNVYYALPAALALVAWSAERGETWPLAGVALAALAWLSFNRLPSLDERALMFAGYVAWALPFAALLAAQLYRGSAERALERRQPLAVALDPVA
jgi:hypothetical protein